VAFGPGKLCMLIMRKYKCITFEEAFSVVDEVKKMNSGSTIGIEFKKVFNLVENVLREKSRKDKEKAKIDNRNEKENAKKERQEKRRLDATCPFCFTFFIDKFARYRHVKTFHSDTPNERIKTKLNNESSEKCAECGKVYKHKISLKRHMEVHKDEADGFDCDICKKKFTRNDNLYKHRERVHHIWNVNLDAVRKEFKDKLICPMCSADFGTNLNKFETHLVSKACKDKEKIVEIDENHRFKCDLCDRSYADMDSLHNHQRWKHNNVNRDFKCSFCEASYSYKSSLVRHVKKSHNGPQE